MSVVVFVLFCNSEMTSVSIVGGMRSSTTDAGSPAEKMMSPLEAMRSTVWSYAIEKDSCFCLVIVSWALHTDVPQWKDSLTANGFCNVDATSLFVDPPMVVSRWWSGPDILKNAPK